MDLQEGPLMARLNTALLIFNATDAVHRAYQVQQDPAVQKVWREAGADFATAGASLARAISETQAAWRRTGTNGAAGLTPRYT